MISFSSISVFMSKMIIKQKNMEIYVLLGVDGAAIPNRDVSHDQTRRFVEYYRMKRTYDAHINKKTHHGDHYVIFPMASYSGFTQAMLVLGRDEKNKILDTHVSNYRFYYYDKNMKMYYATKNLIKQFFYYCQFMETWNVDESADSFFQKEAVYVMNIVHAYNLFYYMLDQEMIISDLEMDRLITEYSVSLFKK